MANDDIVKNKVAESLVKKIIQKFENKEKFLVIIVLPLLPGFAGEIDGAATVMKVQLHW